VTSAESIPVVTVQTLMGEKGIEHSVICLQSVVRYSRQPVRFNIHDDGTLSQASYERLSQALPGVTIIGREEADDHMLPLLRSYRRCSTIRSQHPLFLKLFDLALSGTGHLYYLDSDILFFRPFLGLFDPTYPLDALFMKDMREGYAVRPWRLKPFGPISLASLINTGIIYCKRSLIDLDFIEYLLRQLSADNVFRTRGQWAEQTCWAALAERNSSGVLDPDIYKMVQPVTTSLTETTVAVHFVSTHRAQLFQMLNLQRDIDLEPISVRFAPARTCTAFDLLLSDVKARSLRLPIGRLLNAQ